MRLIDADAMTTHIDFIIPRMLPDKNDGKHYISLETIREWIDEAPTVEAEPIIRCKDCKYFDEVDCEEKLTVCVRNGLYKGFFVSLNDYCSFAERQGER